MTKVTYHKISLSDFFSDAKKGVTNVYYDSKKNRVKTKTFDPTLSERCWHDHHPLPDSSDSPGGMTIKKDFLKDDTVEHHQIGKFCSYECMLAYALSEIRPGMRDAIGYITQEFIKHYPDLDFTQIIPAPPYEVLEAYGGSLSISQFRKGNHNIKKTNHYIILGRSMEVKDE